MVQNPLKNKNLLKRQSKLVELTSQRRAMSRDEFIKQIQSLKLNILDKKVKA